MPAAGLGMVRAISRAVVGVLAVSTTRCPAASGATVIGKLTDRSPAGTVAGRASTAGLLLVTLTAVPPWGAGARRVRVARAVAPATRVAGLRVIACSWAASAGAAKASYTRRTLILPRVLKSGSTRGLGWDGLLTSTE